MLCARFDWHDTHAVLEVPSASLRVQSPTFREVHCCGDTSSRWDCQVTAGCDPPEALSCRRAVRPLMKDTPGTLEGSGWGCLGTALYTFPGLQERRDLEVLVNRSIRHYPDSSMHCGRRCPHQRQRSSHFVRRSIKK